MNRFVDYYKARLIEQANDLIKRHERYINWINSENGRSIRFYANPSLLYLKTPETWKENKHNPYYVRKHADSIAKSVVDKLMNNSYKPNLPMTRYVDKPDGGKRKIFEYQIPDSTVSDIYYRKLLSKNKHRFSGYAYAYREDRNVHFAIQELKVGLHDRQRMFIAEFDFSKYFDSIRHDYIKKQLSSNGLLITEHEHTVIWNFVRATHHGEGVPQGTSISLFLANVACCALDRRLEDLGIRFARYADDTVIWSPDYGRLCQAVDVLRDFGKDSGVLINQQKSDGISLLTSINGRSELARHKTFIEFLGYRVSPESIGMRNSAVSRIKGRISEIIKRCMIDPAKRGRAVSQLIPANNRDEGLMIAVCSIRRYMYGNLQEEFLRGYISGKYRHLTFLGLMSFYPLVDDEEQLKDLDRWLLHTLHRATLKRYRLFTALYGFPSVKNVIYNVQDSKIFLQICHQQVVKGRHLYSIPSFMRIYRAIRKKVVSDGVVATMHPKSNQYGYQTP